MDAPLLDIRGLDVRFRTGAGIVHAVRGVNMRIAAGETVAIVGESGSGKSQTMMAAMGLLAANGKAAGSVRFDGEEILGAPAAVLSRIRGRRVGMIFQEPMTSLDPLYRIGDLIAEPLRVHRGLSRSAARIRAAELLRLVRLSEPERGLASYPHELSGGQRQRVMIALALANDPDLLIADEPTTALDVTIQAEILALLGELRARVGMAIVVISHDLRVVRRIAGRVYVMRDGEVVETADTIDLFARPRHPYTRMLLTAEPSGAKPPPPADAPILVEADHLTVVFRRAAGLFRVPAVCTAVDDVSLTVKRGETLGIVGESGSGKSTLGRALLRLLPASGAVRFHDCPLEALDRVALRRLRRSMQMVFQDPFGSLSPRLTVGEIVAEGLLVHEPGLSRRARDRRAAAALEEVQIDPATRNRFPHEFSGGQRQRIAIARAMILRPEFVVLDEPTSALDRTVQKAIIELLRDLQDRYGLSYLFISHDLAVVRALADEVLVMKDGRIVEGGPTAAIFETPRQPYTRRLIAAAFEDAAAMEPAPRYSNSTTT